MSNVIDMASRRREPHSPACLCRPDRICYPHRLLALVDRMEAVLGDSGSSEVARLVADAHDVIDPIAAECLPDERNVR